MYEFNIDGYDVHHKKATKISTSAHVYVPKSWIGKDVVTILLEELDD